MFNNPDEQRESGEPGVCLAPQTKSNGQRPVNKIANGVVNSIQTRKDRGIAAAMHPNELLRIAEPECREAIRHRTT
jgi:hypothetical protein